MSWAALGKVLGVVFALCLVIIGSLYCTALYQRSRARAFLREFTALRAGVSNFEDAQRLAREFHGTPSNILQRDAKCVAAECYLEFAFKNGLTRFVPWAPRVEMRCWIGVENGLVASRELSYQNVSDQNPTFEYEIRDYRGPQVRGWEYGIWRLKVYTREASGTPHILVVHLNPNAYGDLRNRAYSIDLGCLAKISGCGAASDIYPVGITYTGPVGQTIIPIED